MSVEHPKKLAELRGILKDEKKLVVIDFFATWCGPCIQMEGPVKGFAKVYEDVRILKVDVDDKEFNPICRELKIRAMPTFKFFKGGSEVGEVVGADINGIEEKIKSLK